MCGIICHKMDPIKKIFKKIAKNKIMNIKNYLLMILKIDIFNYKNNKKKGDLFKNKQSLTKNNLNILIGNKIQNLNKYYNCNKF